MYVYMYVCIYVYYLNIHIYIVLYIYIYKIRSCYLCQPVLIPTRISASFTAFSSATFANFCAFSADMAASV